MYCTRCGRTLAEDANYCSTCGARARAAPQGATHRGMPLAGRRDAVAKALVEYGERSDLLHGVLGARPEHDVLVKSDPFAYLVAVIWMQGIPAERTFAVPYELRRRLGHLDPKRIAAEPDAVAMAVAEPPALHRYVEKVPEWIVAAARRVLERYGGDAANIWRGGLTADEVQERLDAFPGIGQKKAAVAVKILAEDLGVPIKGLSGNDVGYDVHVRRVFLRSGLAQYDDAEHMLEVARSASPERPSALDSPAWLIGRGWCRPEAPDCDGCPIGQVCLRDLDRAASVVSV